MARNCNELPLSIDGGKWFAEKVQVLSTVKKLDSNSSFVPVMPISGRKKFPFAKIPRKFCYGTIYTHIIANANLQGVDGDTDITIDVNT